MWSEIEIREGDANLKKQAFSPFRPKVLLLQGHSPWGKIVHARFSGSESATLPFTMSCAFVGDRALFLLDVSGQISHSASLRNHRRVATLTCSPFVLVQKLVLFRVC